MNTTLFLARHGETEDSQAGLYYGRSRSPVTAHGQRQAELLALRLKTIPVAAVYTSPLERCHYAAVLVARAHGLSPIIIDDLIEIDHGEWEGLTSQQVAARFPTSYSLWKLDPAGNSPDGGESGYAVAGRVVPTAIRLARSNPGQTVVAVSHNTVNRILLSHFLGIPLTEYRRRILQHPAALNCIVFHPDGSWHVTLMNDTSHWRGQI
jgi:broad specificity phosphatase PhoE